jgi:putative regulatory protein, FmdB family
MPTYVYQCKACSEQTELVQKMTDPPLSECPSCGGEVRKLLFPPGIVFKAPVST